MGSPGAGDVAVEAATGARASLGPGRLALGEALVARAREVAEAVATALHANRPPVSALEIAVQKQVVRDCTWSTHQLGWWLSTGRVSLAAERRELAERGRTLVDGAMSMADMTKSYLIWRDVVLGVLHEEAARQSVDADALAIAEIAVRRSCDSGLVGMVKEYDIGRQELQRQLDAEHAKLKHLALHDPLTGLPNRALLVDRLGQALTRAERHHETIAVLYLDLDGFKEINDSRGHDAGDQVLIEVGQRLLGLVRSSDTVARLGGDEFVILCERLAGGQRELTALADRVREVVAQPLTSCANGTVSVSVGTVLAAPGTDTDTMLRAADRAMYAAKHGTAA
ncbi:MAG: diguanylate cyclase domain-containing protein [Mycobacteriales bacterium]